MIESRVMRDAGQWLTVWCFDRLRLGIYYCRLFRSITPLLFHATSYIWCNLVWSSHFCLVCSNYLPQGDAKSLSFASISYLIRALLTAVAPNFTIMVVGRFLYGIGIGLVMGYFCHSSHCKPCDHARCFMRPSVLFLKKC